MANTSNKTIKREVRRKRIRSRLSGSVARPRLSVFKSNKFIVAQIIDDENGKTLAFVSGQKFKGAKTEQAKKVGEAIAKMAIEKGIKEVVFDRGGYIYTGRVLALASSARDAGLKF